MHSSLLRPAAWCALIIAALLLLASIQNEESVPQTTSQRTVVSTVVETTVVEVAKKKAESYVGNVKSGKFHRLTCGYAKCKNCLKRFRTREEALDEGYVPGKCCNP